MKGRMAVGFSAVLLVYLLINLYIGWQGARFLEEAAPAFPVAVYWILFALTAVAYMLGRIPAPKGLRPAFRLLKVIGSYYFAVFEFAVILVPLAHLAGWLLDAAGILPPHYAETAGWTVLSLIAALVLWGSRNAWSPVVRAYSLQIDKPAAEIGKLRIVAVSDIHLGNIVGKRHLKRLLARVDELKPDLILLPGDVIDDSIEPFVRNRLSDWLRRLHARYGVYAVLGNHEYYGGHIEEYVSRMKEIGIPVLRDETATVAGSVVIAGRKDKTAESMDPAGRLSVEELLKDVDRAQPIIMMDHQPYHFDRAAEAGVDLLLCGHTHRGQFAPNHWLTKRLFELDWGYMKKGQMHVAVSSGYGTWGPAVRIASRSEILLIDLTFAGKS